MAATIPPAALLLCTAVASSSASRAPTRSRASPDRDPAAGVRRRAPTPGAPAEYWGVPRQLDHDSPRRVWTGKLLHPPGCAGRERAAWLPSYFKPLAAPTRILCHAAVGARPQQPPGGRTSPWRRRSGSAIRKAKLAEPTKERQACALDPARPQRAGRRRPHLLEHTALAVIARRAAGRRCPIAGAPVGRRSAGAVRKKPAPQTRSGNLVATLDGAGSSRLAVYPPGPRQYPASRLLRRRRAQGKSVRDRGIMAPPVFLSRRRPRQGRVGPGARAGRSARALPRPGRTRRAS